MDYGDGEGGDPPGFHSHDLRHIFASHQKMAGAVDFTLMELRGDAVFTMMKRYAHLDPANKQKDVAMLSGWTVVNTWHKEGTNEVEDEKGATG